MFDVLLETIIEIIQVVEQKIEELRQQNVDNARQRKRRYIQRHREAANEKLMHDYFSKNTKFQGYYFRRRFLCKRVSFCISSTT